MNVRASRAKFFRVLRGLETDSKGKRTPLIPTIVRAHHLYVSLAMDCRVGACVEEELALEMNEGEPPVKLACA